MLRNSCQRAFEEIVRVEPPWVGVANLQRSRFELTAL